MIEAEIMEKLNSMEYEQRSRTDCIRHEICELRKLIDSDKNLNLNNNYNELLEAIQKDDTPINVIEHGEICDEINELYSRKNADYGGTIAVSYTHLTLPTNREV